MMLLPQVYIPSVYTTNHIMLMLQQLLLLLSHEHNEICADHIRARGEHRTPRPSLPGILTQGSDFTITS